MMLAGCDGLATRSQEQTALIHSASAPFREQQVRRSDYPGSRQHLLVPRTGGASDVFVKAERPELQEDKNHTGGICNISPVLALWLTVQGRTDHDTASPFCPFP
jgi:hypothetical protein